jgi:superfamily II DNA/RNA helicase
LCRLVANSTALVDKEADGVSSKLDELRELLVRLIEEKDRKIIIFSEWTKMMDLVENQFKELGVEWVRLDGQVPQIKRKALIKRFTDNSEMQFFLTSNAGSTGLNLQAADTVINLDLPWNPAVLEQRISRAHRMGQTKPVQVYLLVTADTIEERLLDLLGAKSALALATLDLDSDTDFVEMTSGIDALKNRLEILLGQKPDKPLESPTPLREIQIQERRQKISEAGSKLLNAVCDFLGEIIPTFQGESSTEDSSSGNGESQPDEVPNKEQRPNSGESIKNFFLSCFHKDDEGRAHFTLPVPPETIIDKVSDIVSKFLGVSAQ